MKRLLLPAALLSIAAASASLPTAAGADDKATKPGGDLARFQGGWTAKAGPKKNVPVSITIKGNTVALKVSPPNGQEYESTGELQIDEKARPNKTIDWVKFTRPNGEPAPENLGIYEFVDRDTLRVCSGGPGNERPTEFQKGEDGPPSLIVFTRKADAPK